MTVKVGDKEYTTIEEMFSAWEAEEKLWPWYKKFYYAWIRSELWPTKIWYRLKCLTFRRYHMLDLRTKEYRFGYADPCSKIIYACFAILVDFVENEKPRERIASDADTGGHWDRALAEVDVLYKYWKTDRYEITGHMKQEEKDQEMLKRLIEIRGYLWT